MLERNINETSLKKNTIYNFMRTALSLLLPLITFPYSSRILHPAGIGRVNFASAIIEYFSLAASLGIYTYGVREGAKLRGDERQFAKFGQEVLVINCISMVIAYIVLGIMLVCVPKFVENRNLLQITSVSILFTTLGLDWVYGAFENYRYIAVRTFAFQIISVVLLFIMVRTERDCIPYAMITVISNVGCNVLNFINARKRIFFRTGLKWKIKKHLKPIFVIFGITVASKVYINIDTAMLGFMCTDSSVGMYNAAVKMNNIVVAAITSLNAVMLPRVSRCINKGEEMQYRTLLNKSAAVISLIATPVAVGLFFISTPLLELFCGAEYINAGSTMKIMAPVIVIISFSNLIQYQILMPLAKEFTALKYTVVAAVVNIISNIFLIPLYQEKGAAVGTLVSESTALWLYCRYVRENNVSFQFHQKQDLAVGCCIISGICILISVIFQCTAVKVLMSIFAAGLFYILWLHWRKNVILMEIERYIRKFAHFS